ncbi:MAG: hypothetical protein AB7P21_02835 [Lautropia sp.]
MKPIAAAVRDRPADQTPASSAHTHARAARPDPRRRLLSRAALAAAVAGGGAACAGPVVNATPADARRAGGASRGEAVPPEAPKRAPGRERDARPPTSPAEWLLHPGERSIDVPDDYLGLHSDHGFRDDTPAPTYRYDAIRSLNAHDKDGYPLLHWDMIEREPGRYDWRHLDRWLELHPGRTRIWVLFGCPPFYQKYPGERWHWPYRPGGGSPPRDPEAAAAMVAALLARHPRAFRFVELWNEPNFGWDERSLREGRWHPASGRPGYFTGTPADLAALARAVRKVLPPQVRLLSGAWEGQWRDPGPSNSLLRFARAPDGAGGLGRDHVQALSAHSYMHGPDPNTMIAVLKGYRDMFARAGFAPGLERHLSECGAEAPYAWTRSRPAAPQRRAAILRWIVVPAALGWRSAYLYKHSLLETLGDPARDPAVADAIDEGREMVVGRRIVAAARLDDGRIWLHFASGADAVI